MLEFDDKKQEKKPIGIGSLLQKMKSQKESMNQGYKVGEGLGLMKALQKDKPKLNELAANGIQPSVKVMIKEHMQKKGALDMVKFETQTSGQNE